MTLYTPPTYIAAIVDLAGTDLGQTFLAVFNPLGSGRAHIAEGFRSDCYAVGVATVASSMKVYRISSVTGGSQRAAGSVDKFVTAHPDPVTQVFINNPTIVTVGNVLLGIPPAISTGAGQSATSVAPTPGASFVLAPGEGLAFTIDAGDTDRRWCMQYLWSEKVI